MPLTKELKIDTSKPVLVTGATGYVAGELVRQLLQDGLTVHATVRDPSKKERLKYLQALADDNKSGGSLKFFKADLLEQGSFAEAMKGCAVVFHTASPFFYANNISDPDKDLIEPAVRGTENVLNQASQTPSVHRVVLTSSVTAIATDACETIETPGQILNEDVWNRTATRDHMPYFLSKTLAEQKAWVIAGGQKQWKLVVLNPSMVLGPGLHYSPTSESYNTLVKLGGGKFETWFGVPNVSCPAVDIRDVAEAHRAAAFVPDAAGRYIVSAGDTNTADIARMMARKKDYSPTTQFPIATRTAPLPKFLIWLLVPLVPSTGLNQQFIRNNINYEFKYDNSKSKRELGLEYRSIEPGVQDMFQQIVDAGAVGPKRWYHALQGS